MDEPLKHTTSHSEANIDLTTGKVNVLRSDLTKAAKLAISVYRCLAITPYEPVFPRYMGSKGLIVGHERATSVLFQCTRSCLSSMNVPKILT